MEKKRIITFDNGNSNKTFNPVIVSASRSTDIPAFYADWFFHRLQVGYSVWTNPFNGVKSCVSFKHTKFVVFWSKNPRPLLPYLNILKEKGIGCYIQYTLNDYEGEKLETGVPPLHERIETFKLLVGQLGKTAVIWRFDPMILTENNTIDDLLRKVEYIGNQLKGYTEKLVFSYADISSYKRVKTNLENNNIAYREWSEALMDEFAFKLSTINKVNGWNYNLATCGEKIDIDKYGIAHNRCIDGDLIARLAWQDEELMRFIGIKIERKPVPGLFGETNIPDNAIKLPGGRYFISTHKKDAGQRKLCGCMASKDIGEYNTCPHLCEYCYANATKSQALDNWERHQQNQYAATITGR